MTDNEFEATGSGGKGIKNSSFDNFCLFTIDISQGIMRSHSSFEQEGSEGIASMKLDDEKSKVVRCIW